MEMTPAVAPQAGEKSVQYLQDSWLTLRPTAGVGTLLIGTVLLLCPFFRCTRICLDVRPGHEQLCSVRREYCHRRIGKQ